ncbi:hypothetical protein K3495_g7726 [Podosphaera aphanis]|nr:hypothetical protein K3495_g7726 [Podosphaera aphanis]
MDSSRRSSSTHALLKFPVVVLLSMILSLFSNFLITEIFVAQKVPIWRHLETWREIGTLVSWRILELALPWFAGYDGYDLVALTILSHGPTLYLLVTFYEVPLTAIIPFLMIDCIATYAPFRLFRPLSPAHEISARDTSPAVANSDILTSTSIHIYMVILPALIYAVTVFTAYRTYLPIYLVTYFDQIPSITAAHSPFYITQFPAALLLGIAAKSFLFVPAVATTCASEDTFNPRTASLRETIIFNLWGYSTRTKLIVERTVVMVLICSVNIFLQTLITVDGVEVLGAIVYSALWALAHGITGVALGIVSST